MFLVSRKIKINKYRQKLSKLSKAYEYREGTTIVKEGIEKGR